MYYADGRLGISANDVGYKTLVYLTDVPRGDVTHIDIWTDEETMKLDGCFFDQFPNLRSVSLKLDMGKWMYDYCDRDNECYVYEISNYAEPRIQILDRAFEACENLESVVIDCYIEDQWAEYEPYEIYRVRYSDVPHIIAPEPPNGGLRMVKAMLAKVEIERDAFFNCPRLREVIIRNAWAVSLKDAAFRDCPALQVLNLHEKKDASIPEMILEPFWEHAHLRFPGCDGLADAEGFAWDAHKRHLLFFRPPVLEGKLTVSGKIRTLQYEQFSCREDIREVALEEGVECIAEKAFSYCLELVRVMIPESVGYIAANAFEGCEKLREILRPDGTPATEVVIGKAYIK